MLNREEEYMNDVLVDIIRLVGAKTKVHDLVESYKSFLRANYPEHVKPYGTRLNNQPEGATAEAVVYAFLEANLDDVQVAEKMDVGGVDFKCKVGDAEFVAEVTCLDAEAVASQSGLQRKPGRAGTFRMITNLLRTKASGKAEQLANHNCPRILVITCQHPGSEVVLGIRGAEYLLTSNTKIAFDIGKDPGKVYLQTELDDSVFFRLENGHVESCRRSISAILLISLSGVSAFVTGILHPDPIYKFPIEYLPTVPFVRLQKWPLENNKIQTEWVTHKPPKQKFLKGKPDRFWYDENLRSV